MNVARAGRNEPCPCGSGKKYKKCHLPPDEETRRKADDPTYLTALHEAGHVIVAHALGRHVEHVRVGAVELPAYHSYNRTGETAVSLGFHRSRPLLAQAVNDRYHAREAFTDAEREWLLSEAIIAWGGPIAESGAVGVEAAMQTADGDFTGFFTTAMMLGQTEPMHDGYSVSTPEFNAAAQAAAKDILLSLSGALLRLTDALAALPGEWPEETIQGALEELGSPPGSHRHLLDRLAEVTESARTVLPPVLPPA